jgi:hypothetical protein
VQRASGIPHALEGAEDKCTTRAHRVARRERVSGNVCLALTVMVSTERRADFGPVHSNITALRILRRRLRTVFAAGMALTFIDRGDGFAKDPKPELLNKLNHSLRPMIIRRRAGNGCTAAITSPRKEIYGVH